MVLLNKDELFQWRGSHDVAFQKINYEISEDVCLRYFDTTTDIVLQVDASLLVLGAVLLQDIKPVAYASKALTPSKTRYANIETEMQVVLFGSLRYHNYLYGRKFLCTSDADPF